MTTNAIDIYDERQGELIPYAESDEWRRAYAVWLAGKRQHTRRAYERIVSDFLQFANVPPAGVTRRRSTPRSLPTKATSR